MPRSRITGILHGERAITADTALRLARFFDMSPDFWLGLQMAFDLETARAALSDRLDREVIPRRLEAAKQPRQRDRYSAWPMTNLRVNFPLK